LFCSIGIVTHIFQFDKRIEKYIEKSLVIHKRGVVFDNTCRVGCNLNTRNKNTESSIVILSGTVEQISRYKLIFQKQFAMI